MTDEPLVASLIAAVESRPNDVPLRLHLAALLLDAERADEAISHLGQALTHDPGNAGAQALMQRALRAHQPPEQTPPVVDRPPTPDLPPVADRPPSTAPPTGGWQELPMSCRRGSPQPAARTEPRIGDGDGSSTWRCPRSGSRTWAA
jgi:hypothetical protein